VGYRHGGEPRVACPGPHLLFILALRDGGPHAIDLAVRPRSGRVTDSGSVVGPIWGRDQTNKANTERPYCADARQKRKMTLGHNHTLWCSALRRKRSADPAHGLTITAATSQDKKTTKEERARMLRVFCRFTGSNN
jgi:hypothetical protein